ncbi:hypothetical protein [Paraburkholderia tropica]|uniref:hypothetical protein n=1 Tax=Paraburkholderia tropica TaxID=92647 RepID=UPI000D761D4B|nr:hypothetical protein [Paraburkholderia tropica]
MADQDGNKVVSGGLVVSMRPQVSVELLACGDIQIHTATVSDDFEHVAINDIRFPLECARQIADELYRLAGLESSGR